MIGKAQWDAYIKKLRAFSETAKLVSQQGLAYEVKEAPGAIITPGTQPISLQLPLQITIYEDVRSKLFEINFLQFKFNLEIIFDY